MEADPGIGEALDLKAAVIMGSPLLSKYYGSVSSLTNYWRGFAYDQIREELGQGVWDEWDEYYDLRRASSSEAKAYFNSHPHLQRYRDILADWDKTASEQIVRFGENISERPIELRPGADQGVLEAEKARTQPFSFSWDQWREIMGAPLSRLVADHFDHGEEIPYAAENALDDIADQFGVNSRSVILLLIQQSLGELVPR